jgi:tight adherence protein C
MNLEYLLAVVFGVGVSGVVASFAKAPVASLSSRVQAPEEIFRTTSSFPMVQNFGELFRARISSANKAKLARALFELPEVLDLLVVNLRAGDGIYRSFSSVVPKCEGELAKELTRVLRAVQFGAAFGDEIKTVAISIPQPQVIEFTNKIALALERGTPLAQMLSELSASTRAEIRNMLLRQAGKNETRMLIPLVFLILPITVLFAIYPSLELLNFGFI